MTDIEFWQAIYIAVIRSGGGNITAKNTATQAIRDLHGST